MADVATSSGTDGPEGETPNQRQARLRREKRQKRMAEQGEDRLAKIKALNGGVAPPAEILGGPTTTAQPRQATVDDPEEADIDTVSGTNTPSARTNARDNPLAAAMLQMQQGDQAPNNAASEDPLVQMMQQMAGMFGGNPQNPNDPNQVPELPPFLQAMMRGQSEGERAAARAPEAGSAYLWRIVHAIFAFGLAIYITLTSTFNGTQLSRTQSVYTQEQGYGFGPRLFVIFATAETVLQSVRFFMEKGQLRGSGMLATVANSGFVPEPFAQYIRILGRYIGIFQTIVSDAMVIIFVLGALAWWKGMGVA
jgi:GET complex subunit GET2